MRPLEIEGSFRHPGAAFASRTDPWLISCIPSGWLLRRLRFQTLPRLLRQRIDHELIRMLDQLTHELRRQAAIEHDGVPMALVHVPAGFDGLVLVPQLDGAFGIAFEIDARRKILRNGDGEHLVANFVHQRLGTKGCCFFRAGQTEAMGDDIGQVHGRMIWRRACCCANSTMDTLVRRSATSTCP